MTTISDHFSLVTKALNPICGNQPHGRLVSSAVLRVSRSASRRLFAQLECVKLSPGQNCQASVRSQVRAIGTHSAMRTASRFALEVRTSGSHPPLREPGRWLPVELPSTVTALHGCQARGFHCGFQGLAVIFTGNHCRKSRGFTGRTRVCETPPHE